MSLLGIGVPHEVLGDVLVQLKLKRRVEGDQWTSGGLGATYWSEGMRSLR